MQLPNQKDFKSKITLKIMLTKENFPTLEQLVNFVNEHKREIMENDAIIIEGYFLAEKFDICKNLCFYKQIIVFSNVMSVYQ